MSLNTIMGIQRKRKERRNQVFKEIYEKVKVRINHYTRFNQTNCTYRVPYIIYGLPHVNLGEIADYLENKLKDEGFVVNRVDQMTIYISWEESIVEEQYRINKEKRKLKKQEQELSKLGDERNRELLKSLVSYD